MLSKVSVHSMTALSLAIALGAGGVHAQNMNEAVARDTIEEVCVTCHNFDDYAGGLDLEGILADDITEHTEQWEDVIRKLRAGMMPPVNQPRPEWDDYVALTEWLEGSIDTVAEVTPGNKLLHRMNRSEYANVIRDLLGLEIDPAEFLPSDTSARGFDNQAGSLTLSPTLLESYANAAARLSRMAVGFWQSPTEKTYIADADTSQNLHLDGMPLNTRGGMSVRHNFPSDGEYTFHIQNFGVGEFVPGEQLELSIDGERIHVFDYEGVGLVSGMGGDRDGFLEVTVPVKSGTHLVGATFVATNYRPPLDLVQQYDRKSIENEGFPQIQYHPVIGILKVSGPFNPQRPEESVARDKIFTCYPSNQDEEVSCAREIFSTLTRKAYRRPVTDSDVNEIMAFYQSGRADGTFEDGVELGIRRLLADPEFLVRTEHEPEGIEAGQPYELTDLELASRLSFFIWSTIPDDELIELAGEGRLSDPDVLTAQVQRMLEDPRSEALVQNFAQQWFYLRNLPSTSPDGIFYPNWDDELRDSFQRETELLFQSVVQEDRSILDLLEADYTFVNERLAKHYNIPNVYGSRFRRVDLGPELDYRRGMLGQGSFLSITWEQNFRTSPVKRGVWVLSNILGTPPPAPPANVPALEETGSDVVINTLRDQMTLHRQNEPCATCHGIMDSIGFALEVFDADGSYRTMEGHPRKLSGTSVPIDQDVIMWDGTPVTGPSGLRENLMKYSPQFVRFAVEKLMTYGVGRGVEYYDMPQVRSIVEEAEDEDYRFSSLVLGVVNSPQFQMRVKQESTL